MNLALINNRVDNALKANRRAEITVIWMAVAIFAAGLTVLGAGFWWKNQYIAGGSLLLESFLLWPVREVLKLRRDNLALQVVPALIDTLTPEKAAEEIQKLSRHLRGEK